MDSHGVKVRVAERRDAGAVAAIYAPFVRETAISFETDPPTPDIMAGRIETTLQRHPWLVATRDGDVIGYAYGSEHQRRAAYRWSVNVTVYVAANAHRRGVGRGLYANLVGILREQGFRSAFAGIALPNAGSVALHEAVGFEPLGIYRDVGFKFGAWHDVGYWRLGLTTNSGAPVEPLVFAAFRETPTFNSLIAPSNR